MRVAIYGGSFNPPHVGHAMVASWIQWTNRADVVWLLPTFRHAFDKALAPWELRVRMAQALADTVGGGCRVEPVEAELPVPSYTVRTLEVLAARHPEHDAEKSALALRQRGIIVRHFRQPRIEQFLRITVGTDEQCAILIQALREITAD